MRSLGARPALLALALVAAGSYPAAGDPAHSAASAAAVSRTFSATTAAAAENPPLWQSMSGCGSVTPLRTIQANPSNYRSYIAGLLPGDRLLLAAGTYTQGLNLWDKRGEPDKCIIVEGPASGSPAIFTNSDVRNLVSFKDSSYIAVRNLSLDGQDLGGDGVRGEAHGVSNHHILLEGLHLKEFDVDPLVSGINSKSWAWNWVIRNSTITSTGTGMYFGHSDGAYGTANFLVENNVVSDTREYNVQFKHQLTRNTSIGMPSSGTTIIRNNVFSKADRPLSGADRAMPNLLVGHWPRSGAGSTDIYQIYGNVLYENPHEGLFQGEGNFSFHDNLLVNRSNDGAYSQPHNDVPKRIDYYNNTVVAAGNGIRIVGADSAYQQRVFGNAVFAGTPLTGGQQSNNVSGSYSAASTYLTNPTAALGAGLDLYPKTGQLQGSAIDYSGLSNLIDYDRDFNYRSRITTYRGAYSGEGVNPGWKPALAIKPQPAASNQLQNGVAVTEISGATGSQQFWTMTVPSGASNLKVHTSGGDGDADPYVRFGSAPTTATYDCGPVTGNNDEICTFPAPAPGTWHVLVDGYAAYSGMTLMASYQTSPACTSVTDTEPNGVGNPQPISESCNQITGTFLNETPANDYYRLNVPAGRTVTTQLYSLTVDYDLYLYDATGAEIASSTNGDAAADQATWTNTGTTAATIDIRVNRYSSTKTTYQLGVSY
ncbi:MAG TPA: PPC domain-containing protein [Jatrophihabitans sp.]|jgi:hypothetical protein|uniref:pre-peptidase C-terminal domain-containing protein n=1 Tax=Jatrophihabitans sp. TaxID=1932789 RepID=UPI002EF0B61B